MSISRNEDNIHNPLGPAILLLWKHKILIVVIAFIATVITYFIMRLLPEEFKAHSQVYVNRLPAMEDQNELISPAAVASLLENNSLLASVREDFAETFQLTPPPIERWVRIFKVETEVLQDTSVRKQLSPILNLSVQATGSSETRYIMERWISRFVKEYGNITSREAQAQMDSLAAAAAKVEEELNAVEQERAQLQSNGALQETLLAEKLALLSPARTPALLRDPLDVQPQGDSSTNQNVRMNLQVEAESNRKGLYEMLSTRLMDAAGESTGGVSTADPVVANLRQQIAETQTSVTALGEAWATNHADLNRATRRASLLRQQLSSIQGSMDRFAVFAALGRTTQMGGSDVQQLSTTTVTPEDRVWPKRTVVAVGMGMIAAILTIIWLLSNAYISSLKRQEA